MAILLLLCAVVVLRLHCFPGWGPLSWASHSFPFLGVLPCHAVTTAWLCGVMFLFLICIFRESQTTCSQELVLFTADPRFLEQHLTHSGTLVSVNMCQMNEFYFLLISSHIFFFGRSEMPVTQLSDSLVWSSRSYIPSTFSVVIQSSAWRWVVVNFPWLTWCCSGKSWESLLCHLQFGLVVLFHHWSLPPNGMILRER